MPIRLIENQPIKFELIGDSENCECSSKEYCQLINKNDQTQWQLNSDNFISNGSFTDGINHWVIGIHLNVTVEITNETNEGACDGKLIINTSGGTGPFQYSKDGILFQDSNEFDDLCSGCYNIIVKDSLGNTGNLRPCIDFNIDCGTYPDAYLFDLKDLNLSKLLNCYLHDVL